MYSIEKKLFIHSATRKVWMALTHKKALQEWMGFGKTQYFELEVGGSYGFFDGEATGKFTEITERKVLEFTWRKIDWNENWPDSLVRIELKDCGSAVEFHLTHTNLPNEQVRADHDADWDLFFIEPMQEWAETDFGGALYGVLPLRNVSLSRRKPTTES